MKYIQESTHAKIKYISQNLKLVTNFPLLLTLIQELFKGSLHHS